MKEMMRSRNNNKVIKIPEMNESFQGELKIFDLLLSWGWFLMLNMVSAKVLYCRKDKPAELSNFYGVVVTNRKIEKTKMHRWSFPKAIS